MAEVTVEINGRRFRMACEDGQEAHLLGLASRFDRHIEGFRGAFGEIGDNRLTVMAGIAVLDELAAAEQRIETLRRELAQVTEAGQAVSAESEALEKKFARRMSEAARKIEAVAQAIDQTGQEPASGGPVPE